MTYTPDPDSREAALLSSLAAGIPLLRARLSAGFGSAGALARACAATPGLEEACAAAEAEGRRARAERQKEEEAANGQTSQLVREREDRAGVREPVRGSENTSGADVVAVPVGGWPLVGRGASVSPADRREADEGPRGGNPLSPPPALAAIAAQLAARRVADEAADPLARITADAARHAPGDFGFVLLVDAKCVAAGMPPMSAWWRWSTGAFYASGKQWGIFLVGRGGGKSTTLERVAASVARYGVRMVPPGQTWTWPFISVGPDDANRRISGIAAVFRADGLAVVGDIDEAAGRKVKPGEGVKIARAPRGSLDLEDVRGNSIQLGSIAGTVGNVSGPSTIGLTIDEAAKLIDARGANPLTEIVASAAQTSRGREGWRAIMSSSAFDRAGIHFQLIDAPPNDVNFIATIGADFIDAALDGFARVAAWEQRRGDSAAAKMIREHMATLHADSPLVPTWTAFPGFGNNAKDSAGRLTGAAWDGAALASRMQAEVLPEAALDGVPPVRFWLRECGSLPMDRGGGVNPMRQLEGLADRNTQLVAVSRGEPIGAPPAGDVGPMKVRGAAPGDARYAGPTATPGGWRGPGLDGMGF